MQRHRRNIQNAQRADRQSIKGCISEGRSGADQNKYSQGNATIDISSIKSFDQKEFFILMKDNLFSKSELAQINHCLKESDESRSVFEIFKEIALQIEDYDSKYTLGIHTKESSPGKLFVLKQFDFDIKPFDICLWPLSLILKEIKNNELKQNFLYCLQFALGKHIYLSELMDGDNDHEMIKDHWSQNGSWHQDADAQDEEDLMEDLQYLEKEYGKKSEGYKLFSALRQRRIQTVKNDFASLHLSLFGECNEKYFSRKRSFSSEIDNLCFDLCLKMLKLKSSKYELIDLDNHDHLSFENYDNGVIFGSHMMQFCWKEDIVQNYYIEHLGQGEVPMTPLGEYVELTEDGPAPHTPELISYAKELGEFYESIDKLYNVCIKQRKQSLKKQPGRKASGAECAA